MKIDDVVKESFILAFIDFLFLIGPGISVIFIFGPTLIFQLDWVKLVILSISFSIPFSVIFTILLLVKFSKNKNNDQLAGPDLFTAFSMGILLNGLLVYLLIFILNLVFHFIPKFLMYYSIV